MERERHPLRRRYGSELALGLVLVAGAGLALFLGRDEGPRGAVGARAEGPAAERAAAEAEPAALEAASAPPAERAGEPSDAREALSGGGELAPDAAELELDPRSPARLRRTNAFRVEVVDEHGNPMPGVDVALACGPREERGPARPKRSRTAVTNSSGLAKFAVADIEPLLAAAPKDIARVARVTIVPEFADAPTLDLPARVAADASFRLELPAAVAATFRPLRVRALGASGGPAAGVNVRWSAVSGEAEGGVVPGDAAATDGEGLAELSLAAYRTLRWRAQRGGTTARYRVELVVPPELPSVEIAAAEFPPSEEIALRMPEAGVLVVKVLDSTGKHLLDGARVALFGWPAESALVDDEQIGTKQTSLGIAPFRVGLGLSLRVEAELEDGTALPGRLELLGPRADGEQVEALVRLGAPRPTVRLRAVDEAGAPIAADVRASFVMSEGLPQVAPARAPAADGALAIPIVGTTAGAVPVRLTLVAGSLRATVELPRLAAGSSHELGTVVLRAPTAR